MERDTSEYRELNIKICGAAIKRKKFLEENGVSPAEARTLCLVPKNKLVQLLMQQPTKTDVPELKKNKPKNTTNKSTSDDVLFSGEAHMSPNYLPKQDKKSRWDDSSQNQTYKGRQSFGFGTQISSTNIGQQLQGNSFAEISGEILLGNVSSRWNLPQNAMNETESVSLIVQPIAILLRDFPRSKLTCSQMETIEEAIVDKVLLAEDMKPQFYGTTYEAGYLAMHCCNNVTSEWIKKIIPSIKPWPSAHMCAIEEAEVPYPKVIVGQFLSSADLPTEVILDNIKHQNAHLNVDLWRMIARKNNNTTAMLALSIDKVSAVKLEETKNRVSFRLVQVILHFEDEDVCNAEPNF